MKKLFLYSYNRGDSAKALKEALGCKLIALENSRYKGSQDKVVINWGCSSLPDEVMKSVVLNHPNAIKKAVDKRLSFESFKEVMETTPFTTNKEEAIEWIKKGKEVVVRGKVNGHGGEGISLCSNEQELPDAPLYTQYIPKTEEYRVHVFQGKIIFRQRKARSFDVPNDKVNWKVRNLAGGFIFANQEIILTQACEDMAILSVKSLGLDFGSVDIIYNKTRDAYYVLEVNTASGLQGKTLEAYVGAFKECV